MNITSSLFTKFAVAVLSTQTFVLFLKSSSIGYCLERLYIKTIYKLYIKTIYKDYI